MQTRQGEVHFPPLERSYLRPMKAAFVGKHVLTPALLHSQIAKPVSQTPLQLLPLHFQQFGGTLRKHILLIRRGHVIPPVKSKSTRRSAIPKDLQVRVFRRDGWLCHWCGRPVIFAPAMRYLEKFVRDTGFEGALAYYDPRWRRDTAPLLDHLAAVIDHVLAHSRRGTADEANFVTACNKCNMRKNNLLDTDFSKRSPLIRPKGKYGEPELWDGLSWLFVCLIERQPTMATPSERAWLEAFRSFKSAPTQVRPTAVV
jgi:5-methylcytosine-specific restriction endonuclease McrA